MANKRRPYGIYKGNPEHISPYGPDVADCQEFLPQGERIRNKKAKRRYHNKVARATAKKAMNDDVRASFY